MSCLYDFNEDSSEGLSSKIDWKSRTRFLPLVNNPKIKLFAYTIKKSGTYLRRPILKLLIAKLSNDFHWGFFIVSKAQWIVSLTIMFKVFDLPLWTYFIIPLSMMVFIFIIGRIFNKYLREGFLESYYKDFKFENKTNNKRTMVWKVAAFIKEKI